MMLRCSCTSLVSTCPRRALLVHYGALPGHERVSAAGVTRGATPAPMGRGVAARVSCCRPARLASTPTQEAEGVTGMGASRNCALRCPTAPSRSSPDSRLWCPCRLVSRGDSDHSWRHCWNWTRCHPLSQDDSDHSWRRCWTRCHLSSRDGVDLSWSHCCPCRLACQGGWGHGWCRCWTRCHYCPCRPGSRGRSCHCRHSPSPLPHPSGPGRTWR